MKRIYTTRRVAAVCAGILAFSVSAAALPDQLRASQTGGPDVLPEPVLKSGESEVEVNPPDYYDEEESVTEEAERGAYVIYAQECISPAAEDMSDIQEFSGRAEGGVIYETDLSEEELAELKQADEIYVEENFFLFGAGSEEEFEAEGAVQECTDWNYQMIRAAAEEEEHTPDHPVKVAVLDSGIELLSGIPVCAAVNLVKEEQEIPFYMNDMAGHGTAVADIIHQICPKAEIYAARVLDKDNRGRLSDVVEGISVKRTSKAHANERFAKKC